MKLRPVLSFGSVFIIYNLLMFYLGWNGWVWLNTVFSFQHIILYAIAFALLSYSFVLGKLIKPLNWFSIIGAYWFAVVQYGLLLFPLANLTILLLCWFSVPVEIAILWTGSITIVIFTFLFFYGTFNAFIPVVRNYEIAIPKRAKNYKELCIVVASDMHLGKLSGTSHLKRLVATVEKLKPDLLLLPGDIIDDEPHHFINKNMGTIMKELQAPLGIYGVLGNHEYYGKEIPAFMEQMKKIDIKILMDEVVKIDDSFYLLGRKDKTDSKRKSFQELVENLDPTLPLISMDHQPSQLKEAQQSGIDLIVSGHTHRGQMAPNHLITQKIFELDWGYLKKNQLHAIVSSGFGFWGPPIRIGSRSVVVEIKVRFK